MSPDLWRLGAIDAAAKIRDRRHNCCDDIVAGDVERMPTIYPELNAVTVEPGDDALQAGRPADAALAVVALGKQRGRYPNGTYLAIDVGWAE